MIGGLTGIRDAYRDTGVARAYVRERFVEPLGALLHARQRRALLRLVRTYRPKHVLEIAPGPARLTVEVAGALPAGGTIMDASPQMLAEARRRMAASARAGWRYVLGDAFQLPFESQFDFVYTFRFIRHFEAADRRRLYAQMARVLRPGGLLAFDVVNAEVSAPLRLRAPDEYRHYDALLRPDTLRDEMADAGFDVVALEGVQHSYSLLYRLQVLVAPRSRSLARVAMEATDRARIGAPLEWIVTCRRR